LALPNTLLELFEIEQADQWAETIKDNPVMIDYELKEISELIADPIRRSDMHTAILDYMAKNWEVGTRCYTRNNFAVDGWGASVLSFSSIHPSAPYDAVLNLIRSPNVCRKRHWPIDLMPNDISLARLG
jgi:hypothetical protein